MTIRTIWIPGKHFQYNFIEKFLNQHITIILNIKLAENNSHPHPHPHSTPHTHTPKHQIERVLTLRVNQQISFPRAQYVCKKLNDQFIKCGLYISTSGSTERFNQSAWRHVLVINLSQKGTQTSREYFRLILTTFND